MSNDYNKTVVPDKDTFLGVIKPQLKQYLQAEDNNLKNLDCSPGNTI